LLGLLPPAGWWRALILEARGGLVIDALVMTLGFEPGPLISAYASAVAEGLSEGARVLVLTAAFPDERSERAWLDFQRVVSMMEATKGLGVELELREVPLDDMASAILEVKRAIAPLRGRSVKVSITGGMRALAVAVLAAVLLTRWEREPAVEVHLEGRGAALRVPKLRKLIEASEKCADLVEAMRDGSPVKLDELAARLGRDRSTVYRRMRILLEAGAAKRVRGGYQLTPLGLALADF
jgi:CRISPR locus-related DNA-binding protein